MFYNVHCHHLQVFEKEIKIYNVLGLETPPQHHFFSAGFHPWQELVQATKDYYQERLLPIWSNQYCIAIGEIGLDKVKGPEWKDQIHSFQTQLYLSKEFDKPVIIHCVKAYYEVLSLLKRVKWDKPYIFHGFNKSYRLAKELLQKGAILSFGMPLREYAFMQEVFMPLWRDYPTQILLETDTHIQPVRLLYQQIANALNVALSNLCEIIEMNVKNTFNLPDIKV
ncbi:MAG: TatD family hydrolase [Bacteroidia bacterium]|nr:TatD family hydrolase [Bacteroidia bacterium]MDW8345495.1 TatD family hydrolase [Bacteroidia bacterium]